MIRYLCIACFSLLLVSCASEFDSQLLVGKWKTVSWINKVTGKKIKNKMDFQFNNDELYEIDYGSLTEKGKYWIANEFLHTVEEGQSEKKVKIISLSQDSMVFEMNRAGILEKVVLVKQ